MLNKINKLLPIVNRYRLAEEYPLLELYKDSRGYVLEEKVNNGCYWIDATGLRGILEYLESQIAWYKGGENYVG